LFLLAIDYKDPFYIGNLRQRLKLDCGEKNEIQVRSTKDFKLDVSELIAVLKQNKEKIADISLRVDSRLAMIHNGELIDNIIKDEL